jgi:hypothetical protein
VARVVVQGNTDERGSREYNIALVQRRADAVKQVLRLLGAEDRQGDTASFGKEKPRCTASDDSCRTRRCFEPGPVRGGPWNSWVAQAIQWPRYPRNTMPKSTLHPEPEFTLGASSLKTDDGPGRALSAGKGRNGPKVAALTTLAFVVGAAAVHFFWPRSVPLPEQAEPTSPVASAPSLVPSEPAIRHPVDSVPVPPAMDNGPPQSAMPALDHSDVVAKDAIEAILNGDAYIRLLAPDGIIRHIVATIDSLPRKAMAAGIRPVVPVPGAFATTDSAHGMSIAGGNGGRYTAYVDAAESIDSRRLVQFYVRLYPQFQQAYVDLGYPNGYFNDRLIAVIDHLLAAPEPKPPIQLSQPKVLFEFANPDLEDLSAGQKVLVRVGLDNELRLKAKLRDVRNALTGKAASL